MTEKIFKGKRQISEAQRLDLAKVATPDYRMGELPIEAVPEEFSFLRAVADCIYGMAFYEGQPVRNLENGLKVIEFVRADLDQAEADIREALSCASSG